MDISPAGYSSFVLSKTLYELSGWPGDVDWADWLPISTQNHPAYTCGYLIRQLVGVVTGFGVSIRGDAPIRYEITYLYVPPPATYGMTPFRMKPAPAREASFFEATAESIEDALTQFCIELWKHNKFLVYKLGR